MGQPLPLPERIPLPRKPEDVEKLELYGIVFKNKDKKYVEFTLPEGWKLVDNSWRSDLPEWFIMNTEDLVVASISGSWKGEYDNDIKTHVFSSPESRTLRKTPAEQMPHVSEQLITPVLDNLRENPTQENISFAKAVCDNVIFPTENEPEQ